LCLTDKIFVYDRNVYFINSGGQNKAAGSSVKFPAAILDKQNAPQQQKRKIISPAKDEKRREKFYFSKFLSRSFSSFAGKFSFLSPKNLMKF
jgi:hypothetical protein